MLFSCLSMHIIFLHFSLQQSSRKLPIPWCGMQRANDEGEQNVRANLEEIFHLFSKKKVTMHFLNFNPILEKSYKRKIKRDINKLADDILFHFHLELTQIIYLQCNHCFTFYDITSPSSLFWFIFHLTNRIFIVGF